MAFKSGTHVDRYYATECERPTFSNMNGYCPDLSKDNGCQDVVHKCPLGVIVANEKVCYRTERDPDIPKRCCCGKEDRFVIPDSCCVEVEPATSREIAGKKISCRGPCGDGNDANDYYYECRCEKKNATDKKQDKKVHFNEEVAVYDCDEAFRSLQPDDVNDLCRCCRKCVKTGTEECVGRPVLMYEIPEPKMEDISLYHKDYVKHEVLPKDLPPWHPIMKERWNRIQVPSLAETTYQADFRPPPVSKKGRNPVYLAPQKETRDPCEELSESFKTWKRTSGDDCHLERVHSEKCCLKHCAKCDSNFHLMPETDNCARDLPSDQGDGYVQRVYSEKCRLKQCIKCCSNLRPESCNCARSAPTNQDCSCGCRPRFGLQEADTGAGSRYWWKRSCCEPGEKVEHDCVPAELVMSVPQEFTTTYERDFKEPEITRRATSAEECDTCNCLTKPLQKNTQPNLLCTKYPHENFITQRVGII